ncbi:MAG: immunity 17 family protein [Anaerolineaceae bacterium]|nr:immunity 17 family protein [Anaerolineaceae bacterium]
MAVTQYIFIAIGLFSIAGGIFNWEWFINSRKFHLFEKLLGRYGTRIAYIIMGLFLICLALIWL